MARKRSGASISLSMMNLQPVGSEAVQPLCQPSRNQSAKLKVAVVIMLPFVSSPPGLRVATTVALANKEMPADERCVRLGPAASGAPVRGVHLPLHLLLQRPRLVRLLHPLDLHGGWGWGGVEGWVRVGWGGWHGVGGAPWWEATVRSNLSCGGLALHVCRGCWEPRNT